MNCGPDRSRLSQLVASEMQYFGSRHGLPFLQVSAAIVALVSTFFSLFFYYTTESGANLTYTLLSLGSLGALVLVYILYRSEAARGALHYREVMVYSALFTLICAVAGFAYARTAWMWKMTDIAPMAYHNYLNVVFSYCFLPALFLLAFYGVVLLSPREVQLPYTGWLFRVYLTVPVSIVPIVALITRFATEENYIRVATFWTLVYLSLMMLVAVKFAAKAVMHKILENSPARYETFIMAPQEEGAEGEAVPEEGTQPESEEEPEAETDSGPEEGEAAEAGKPEQQTAQEREASPPSGGEEEQTAEETPGQQEIEEETGETQQESAQEETAEAQPSDNADEPEPGTETGRETNEAKAGEDGEAAQTQQESPEKETEEPAPEEAGGGTVERDRTDQPRKKRRGWLLALFGGRKRNATPEEEQAASTETETGEQPADAEPGTPAKADGERPAVESNETEGDSCCDVADEPEQGLKKNGNDWFEEISSELDRLVGGSRDRRPPDGEEADIVEELEEPETPEESEPLPEEGEELVEVMDDVELLPEPAGESEEPGEARDPEAASQGESGEKEQAEEETPDEEESDTAPEERDAEPAGPETEEAADGREEPADPPEQGEEEKQPGVSRVKVRRHRLCRRAYRSARNKA